MEKLQELVHNINSAYQGKIDPANDFYAYIDESGDEGSKIDKNGVSTWFNVSAIILSPSVSINMVSYIEEYRESRSKKKKLENMSAKDLNHHQRKDLFFGLSKFNFITCHSLFYKPMIERSDYLNTYPSMYFVGVKNVIERLSWCTKQFKKRVTHIIISNRNIIKSQDLRKYLFETSVKAGTNLAYQERIGLVKLSNFNLRPQLLLADYSAYSLRMAVEEMGNPPCTEPDYFNWYQKGKLFSSNHGKYHGIWGNGLKVIPNDEKPKILITKSDILNEGSHK